VRAGQTAASAAANSLASAAPAAGLMDLFDAPRARFAPAPYYPDEARWEGREGRVVLRFRLRADGRVGEADIVTTSGHADLDAAALATIRGWSFSAPSGLAPEAWYRHAFRFALR
jgi:protein TonB